MKKIYMAGCGGMLGQAFYEMFSNDYILKCTDKDVNSEWLSFLDFRDFAAYEKNVTEFKPDYLFHLGAYTDLEYCELHPDDTYQTNTASVEHAVHIANKLSIPVLYISTAGIFDGKKEEYDDWDIPNPLGVYARTKYDAECFVEKNAHTYLICRAGWMMGGGSVKDKKFVNKIIKQINEGKRGLFIVDDKDGTPTYTRDFAANVMHLIENESWGLYNMVSGGQTSRLEVAKEILKILKLETTIKLTPVSSEFFTKTYFAPRPVSERLINKKLNQLELNKMQNWRVALKEYITTDFSHLLPNLP